jgi:hypothetical protein
MSFDRKSLIELLRDNVVVVTFMKIDGTERKMRCTLQPEYVPNAATNGKKLLGEGGDGGINNNNVSVWDIDASGWRSFRVESIKSVSLG